MGGPRGAAFIGCALTSLQDCPLDMACFYRSDVDGFGLFTSHGSPRKVFFAFKAFRALADAPLRAEARGGDPGRLAVCAGLDREKTRAVVLVSNFASPGSSLTIRGRGWPWPGGAAFEASVVDATRDLAVIRAGELPADGALTFEDLEAPAVLLLKLRRP
jgi:hypothetical protein